MPPPYPVRLPSVPMTRWHGTTMATGFAALAKPTARTDFGRPNCRASAPKTQRCTGLDRSECRPNLALKRGASGCDGDRIDRAEIAREVVADRPPNCRGCGAVLHGEVISVRAIMEPKKTPHAWLEVVKVQSAHMSFAIMDEKQCSDRALEAICVQGLRRYWGSHRHSPKAGACARPGSSSVHGPKMLGRIGSPRPPTFGPCDHLSGVGPAFLGSS